MKPPVSLTFDLEDPSERYEPNGRYVALTDHILDLCEAQGRKATFFTIGRLAEAAPDLIRRIAAQGHEIAYHSRAHASLTEQTPAQFAREAAEDKDKLEQLAGAAVTGFRAPRYSLTPQSLWATDVLAEKGFLYSSSIMPTALSRFGFPEAGTEPFLWPSGVLELPLPVASLAGARLPYLGGIYLYAWPSFIVRFFLGRASDEACLWTYAHPYDFDREEGYSPMPSTPLWVSLILWAARRQAERKILRLCQATLPAPTLGERARAFLKRESLLP